jgi:hypothetical protein
VFPQESFHGIVPSEASTSTMAHSATLRTETEEQRGTGQNENQLRGGGSVDSVEHRDKTSDLPLSDSAFANPKNEHESTSLHVAVQP